MILSGMIYIQ